MLGSELRDPDLGVRIRASGCADQSGTYLGHSLNPLKGGYIGDHVGNYYRSY